MMAFSFTEWLWVNWALLAFTLGAFWTLGAWLMTALLGALRRGPG